MPDDANSQSPLAADANGASPAGPVYDLLVNKYGMDPKQAHALSTDISQNVGYVSPGKFKVDPQDIKGEAVKEGAAKALQGGEQMARRAQYFTDLHKLRATGQALTPEEEKWYQSVIDIKRRQLAEAGRAAQEFQARNAVSRLPEGPGPGQELQQLAGLVSQSAPNQSVQATPLALGARPAIVPRPALTQDEELARLAAQLKTQF
jgi:hypothetical protein